MSKSEKITVPFLGNQAGAVVLSLLLPFAAGASGIGYKETVGVHVPAGTSETLSGNIIEGTDGKFFKTGEGTLTVCCGVSKKGILRASKMGRLASP